MTQFPCSMSFYSHGRKAVHIQNLVKRFAGRFKTNYTLECGVQYVDVGFMDGENMNKFALMQRITAQRFF